VHSLCDGGAAVLLEARGIEHPVTECSVAPFSLDYALSYGLGGHLEPHIRTRGPIPLTITEQGAPRDNPRRPLDGQAVVVAHDRPPSHREGLRGAPVHRPEPAPLGRHLEGLHHMLFVAPTVEVGPLYDGPIAFEPRSHQRVAADHLQVCNVL